MTDPTQIAQAVADGPAWYARYVEYFAALLTIFGVNAWMLRSVTADVKALKNADSPSSIECEKNRAKCPVTVAVNHNCAVMQDIRTAMAADKAELKGTMAADKAEIKKMLSQVWVKIEGEFATHHRQHLEIERELGGLEASKKGGAHDPIR